MSGVKKVIINEQTCTEETLKAWEQKRVKAVSEMLHKTLGTPLVNSAKELTDLKMSIPDEKLRSLCKKNIRKSDRASAFLMKLSRGKTRNCVVEMEIQGAGAQEMKDQYYNMMFHNNEENRRLNLSANPDHFSLLGKPGYRQDVVESSGAMSSQSRFFVCFGDDEGMHSVPDPDYPVAAVGSCRTGSGLVIGGCRHQFRDTDYGCYAKLTVEFPKATPAGVIREHQLHVGVEFSNWINDWVVRAQNTREDPSAKECV